MEIDMADVKPSLVSLVLVTLMAVVGIAGLKILIRRFPIPGLSDLVNTV